MSSESEDLLALAARLQQSEATIPDLRPGLGKEIVFADPAHPRKTPLSLVYLHGFSASRQEMHPLPEKLATALGANLFLARLAGHGRTGDAMAEATLAAWLADAEEAFTFGARLGERCVLLATSTGATLALATLDRLLAARPAQAAGIAGMVLFSPNLALASRAGRLLEGPGRRWLARLLIGRRRSFVPLNPLQAAGWTTDYPVESLFPMMDLIRSARRMNAGRITVPTLVLASPRDQVVDYRATRRLVARLGGPASLVDPEPVGDPFHHVVAGDALSPQTTARVIETVQAFLRRQGLA